ncbi:MFS transporter, partial [Mesorhizobium sp. M00.F.Ca.ET.186.01.1.1]
ASAFSGQGAVGAITDPRAILTPEARAAIPAPVLEKMTDILASSIAHTFLWALVPALLAVVCILLMGNERVVTSGKKAPQAKPERG